MLFGCICSAQTPGPDWGTSKLCTAGAPAIAEVCNAYPGDEKFKVEMGGESLMTGEPLSYKETAMPSAFLALQVCMFKDIYTAHKRSQRAAIVHQTEQPPAPQECQQLNLKKPLMPGDRLDFHADLGLGSLGLRLSPQVLAT